ncbi:uncharacterized protein [Glycine max]|nr:uncharacterized protein LOC102660180 [Glycine max]
MVLVCEIEAGMFPVEQGDLHKRWKLRLADYIGLPCRIARGCKYCVADHRSSCLVKIKDDKQLSRVFQKTLSCIHQWVLSEKRARDQSTINHCCWLASCTGQCKFVGKRCKDSSESSCALCFQSCTGGWQFGRHDHFLECCFIVVHAGQYPLDVYNRLCLRMDPYQINKGSLTLGSVEDAVVRSFNVCCHLKRAQLVCYKGEC